LDSIADKLKQDPRATLVVDGHQDKAERANVALTRARNAATYLVRQKGIEPGRILIRSFGARRPHPSGRTRMNRRVEMWIVPVGAEMPPDRAATRETLAAPAPKEKPPKPAPKREKPAPKPQKPKEQKPQRKPAQKPQKPAPKQQKPEALKPEQKQPPAQQQKPSPKQKPDVQKQKQKQPQKPARKEQPRQVQKQKQGQPQEPRRSSSPHSPAASQVVIADTNGTSVPVVHRQRSLRVTPIRSETPPPATARQVARR